MNDAEALDVLGEVYAHLSDSMRREEREMAARHMATPNPEAARLDFVAARRLMRERYERLLDALAYAMDVVRRRPLVNPEVRQ